jgi:hypothetical protein
MTARKNHNHECGTDRERGERTCAVTDDGASNSQNEEKCTYEFNDVFVQDQPLFWRNRWETWDFLEWIEFQQALDTSSDISFFSFDSYCVLIENLF